MYSPVQTTQATTALHHHPNSQLQARISKPHTSRMPHQPKSRTHDDVVADLSHVLIVTLIPPIVNTT
ncbi:hypothetical protein FOC1_g10011698 [Fusarium oxysporum f. sp. cubense race 1]|uniref:Uncharacterized protein n=1 Tax=Fusarium oxysporum f. sp. cubense (strain race 1) TaxID=1229664 RepID=N4UH20_FUSC1|nr:hypothetical protein FOC1_g10011698 [Fusarium oxysporum f. sp. cubense race 1]